VPRTAMFVFSSIQATLLLAVVLLGIAARRQRELADSHAGHGGSVFITDEVDVVAADAELAAAAARRALDEADRAHDRALWASTARDIAEQRHRQVLKKVEAAGQTRQLVQRAALAAYQRGQLSVDELNRIWRHADITAESTRSPVAVPLGWELRVHEARQRYEQAAAAAARAEEEAQQAAVTAAELADEARAAESLLSAAQRSANIGLAGLLRSAWAEPVAR
jgi:predicted amidophosphoribosyltransferase